MNPLTLSVTGLSTASFAPVNNDVATSLNQQATVASAPLFPQQPTSGTVNSFLSAANGSDAFTPSPTSGNLGLPGFGDGSESPGPSSQNSAADMAATIVGSKLNELGDEGDGCRWGFRIGGAAVGGAAGYGAAVVAGGGLGAAAGFAAGGPAGAGVGAALATVGLGLAGVGLGYTVGKDLGDTICGAAPAPAAPAAPAVDEGTYIGEVDDPNFVNGNPTGSGPTRTDPGFQPDDSGCTGGEPTPNAPNADKGTYIGDVDDPNFNGDKGTSSSPDNSSSSTDSSSSAGGPAATETTQPDPAPVPDGDLPPDDASGTSSGPAGPRSDFMPADDSVGGGTPRSNAANVANLAAASASALQLIALSRTQIA